MKDAPKKLIVRLDNGCGHVYLDGEEVVCSRLVVDMPAGVPSRVEIHVPVQEVDIEAAGIAVDPVEVIRSRHSARKLEGTPFLAETDVDALLVEVGRLRREIQAGDPEDDGGG